MSAIERLSEAHLKKARACGWSDETIALWGIYTTKDPAFIARSIGLEFLRSRAPAIVFDLYLPGSNTPYLRRFRPDRHGKGPKYIGPKKDTTGLRSIPIFPPRARAEGWLRDASRPLYITEGEFKTGLLDQLGLAAVGCGGVTVIHDPEIKAREKRSVFRDDFREHIVWPQRVVVIVFDADSVTKKDVRREERRIAFMAREAGAAEVRIVRIPPGDPEAKGIDDYFHKHGEAKTRALLASAEPFVVTCDPAEDDDDRPEIVIRTAEHEVVREAIAALASSPDVYQRGPMLVHVIADPSGGKMVWREPGAPRISPIPKPVLRTRLAQVAHWLKVTEDDEIKDAHPPGWCIDAVHTLENWPGVRVLTGTVEVPIIRPDGSVLATPGYDEATGLLYAPACDVPAVPDRPTLDEARAAAADLLEAASDFPFADDAARAAFLAAMLTPFARHAFPGPAPLFLIEANVRGAGKSLLADLIGVLANGRRMARTAYVHDEDEMRKSITAVAIGADPLVLLDNVASSLGCAALDTVLTGTTWKNRILGKNETTKELPLVTLWYATGNNVVIAADTARRTLRIRLESPEENPEDRQGFRHPDLLAWARAERPRLVRAALVVLRAFFVAGAPSMGLAPWGSFEGWSSVVRAAVRWCGLADPKVTQQALREDADSEAMALQAVIDGIATIDRGGYGLTARQLLDALEAAPNDFEALRCAIETIAPPPRGAMLPSSKSLGKALHRFRGRVVNGRALHSRASKGMQVWSVKRADGGFGGFGGFDSVPLARDPENANRALTSAGAVAKTNHPNHSNQPKRIGEHGENFF